MQTVGLKACRVPCKLPDLQPLQALIQRGVTGDFRAPDIIRFGFTALYTSYEDLWNAIQHLKQVMQHSEWNRPEYQTQSAVT